MRHDLVWLSPSGWERAAEFAPAGARAAVRRWGRAGWPAVATRAPHDLAPGHLPLGLALPPRAEDGARPRIALSARRCDSAAIEPALSLAQALPVMPTAWRRPLLVLIEDARRAGLDLRVYGSVAWQTLTGQGYLRPSSDIDLLLQPRTREQYRGALSLLARHAGAAPLDGEIVFPQDRAVAWKELLLVAGTGERVLSKSMHGIALVTMDSLLASFTPDPCTT